MTDLLSDGDGVPITRRDALKGLAGVGAASALVEGPAGALLEPGETQDPYLPAEMVREVYGPYDHLDGKFEGVETLATRGVTQTNMTILDDEDSWRNECDGVPSIEHRFTTVGYFRGLQGAELAITTDDLRSCGPNALTPNYLYYSSEWPSYDQDLSYASTREEMESEVRRLYDSEFEEGDPRDWQSILGGSQLVTGLYLAWKANPHPAVRAADALLTAASFIHALSQSEPDLDHELDPYEIDMSIDDASTGNVTLFFVDFSVVVPSGESATVEIEQRVTDTQQTYLGLDDVSFEIDIPAIHHEEDVQDAPIPSISVESGPLQYDVQDDQSLALDADLPADGRDWENVQWHTGESGWSTETEPKLEGGHEVWFEADDESLNEYTPPKYRCTRPAVVGDPTNAGVPSVSIDGPSEATPNESVTFSGEASSPNGSIASHVWRVYTYKREAGEVLIESESRDGPPTDYEVSLPAESYDVELSVTDEFDVTGSTRRDLDVAGEGIDVEIVGPDVVPVGQDVQFSYDVANDVTVDSISWLDALIGNYGEQEPEETFEELGERTAELYVLSPDRGEGRDIHEFEVVEETPVDVSADGPAEAAPGESVDFTGEASSPNGEIEGHVWTVYAYKREAGRVVIESESRDGPPTAYETALDAESYEVELSVTDEFGVGASATSDLDVSGGDLAVTIDGPDEVPVGQDVTFSFSVEEDVEVDAISWLDALVGNYGEREPTESFDETGTVTAGLQITGADRSEGTDVHEFEVVEETPVDVAVDGPASATPGETVEFTGEGSSPNGSIASHRWAVYTHKREVGEVLIESDTRDGPPSAYETSLDAEDYEVELSVTDAHDVSASARTDLDVEGTAPTLSIDGPSEVVTGADATFAAEIESGTDVDVIDWTGALLGHSGETVEASFSETGSRTAEVTVITTDDATATATHDFDVVESQALDVSVSGPAEARPGESVTFSGTASSPNGSIDSHRWAVYTHKREVGEVVIESESRDGSPTAYETSLDAEDYEVELSVTDEHDVSGDSRVDLDVEGTAPTLSIDGPSEVVVGQTATFTARIEAGTDVDVIDWTDALGGHRGDRTADASFSDTGSRTAGVTVITTDDATATATHDFDVVESQSLEVSVSGPSEARPDESVTFTADVDSPNGSVDSWVWRVTTTEREVGEVVEASESGDGAVEPLTVSLRQSNYDVELSVTDEVGETGEDEVEIDVSGPDFGVTIDGPDSVAEGTSATFSFSTSRSVGVDGVSWSGAFYSTDPSPTETFVDPGTKTVEVHVVAADGGEGSDTFEFDVDEVSWSGGVYSGGSLADGGDSSD